MSGESTILARLLIAYSKCPNLRFGQFLDNAITTGTRYTTLYYLTDLELLELCERYVENTTS